MIYVAILYWLVTGFALYLLPSSKSTPSQELFVFVFCLLIGGIVVPARLVAKVIS